MLVLGSTGRCSLLETHKSSPGVRVRMPEQRRTFCLQRESSLADSVNWALLRDPFTQSAVEHDWWKEGREGGRIRGSERERGRETDRCGRPSSYARVR